MRSIDTRTDDPVLVEVERLLGLLLFARRCLERKSPDGAAEAISDAIRRADTAIASLRERMSI